MPEHQPHKSRTFPSPFQLAFLIIVIAVGTLSAVLLSFGALGNVFGSPSVIKQAQAIESPTSETVEPPAEIPTTELTATVEITATLEPSATPTETVNAVDPTARKTKPPTPESTDSQVTIPAPTGTPPDQSNSEALLFVSANALYSQSVDSHGKPTKEAAPVSMPLGSGDKLGLIIPSPRRDRALVFVEHPALSDSDGTESVYLYSAKTGETNLLLKPGEGVIGADFYGWHPNNKQLVYSEGDGTIWLFNVNTGERERIADTQAWANLPYAPEMDGIAFSPNGQYMVVSFTLTGTGWQVWRANADGTEPVELFDSEVAIFNFSWSPNSQQIAFVGYGVEIMNFDGQDRRRIAKDFNGGIFPPAWSPNGRYLVFSVEAPPRYKVRVVEVESGTSNILTDDPTKSDVGPAWSTVGQRIAFLSNWLPNEGATEIWVADADGSNIEKLSAPGKALRSMPAWLRIH